MAKNDDKLRRAAHHVAHDVRMLGRAFDKRDNAFAYTAWFVHCRSVMEFFREDKENKDDIVVTDFLPTWKEDTKKPDGYDDMKTAVNKLAAHLTHTRLKYEKGGEREAKGLPSEEITNYLLGLTHLFLEALPAKRRVWFGGVWR